MEILAAARFARKILPKEVKIFSAGLESKGIHPMVTIKTFILSIGIGNKFKILTKRCL